MTKLSENSALNNASASLSVEWDRQARSDLAKLANHEANRIQRAVKRFGDGQERDVQLLQGVDAPHYRLRMGSIRVIFQLDEGGIRVQRVHHRREADRKSALIRQDVSAADADVETDSPDDPQRTATAKAESYLDLDH